MPCLRLCLSLPALANAPCAWWPAESSACRGAWGGRSQDPTSEVGGPRAKRASTPSPSRRFPWTQGGGGLCRLEAPVWLLETRQPVALWLRILLASCGSVGGQRSFGLHWPSLCQLSSYRPPHSCIQQPHTMISDQGWGLSMTQALSLRSPHPGGQKDQWGGMQDRCMI